MKKQVFILAILLVRKPQVVLHLRGKSPLQLGDDAKSYVDGMTKNVTRFPSPNPPLGSVTTLISNLEAAITAAASKAKGTVALRNTAKKALVVAMKNLALYVETICCADPDNAEAIAKLANMTLKKHTLAKKADFSMVPTLKSGELLMTARSEKGRVTFNFEITTDPTLATGWRSVQNKSLAKVLVTGLVSGTRYYGRVTKTDRTGSYQLGQTLSVSVH